MSQRTLIETSYINWVCANSHLNLILQEWYQIGSCMCKENSLKTFPSLNREKIKK